MTSPKTLRVTLGASGVSFNATFALESGEGQATWFGSDEGTWVHWHRQIRRDVELEPLDAAELTALRAFATQMKEEGDYTYRDQFAQAGVTFTLSDPAITWEYQLDGGVEVNSVYSLVADRVFAALDAQRQAEASGPPLLPVVADDAALLKLHRQTEPWLAAARDVAKKQQLAGDTWVRASDGSQIVMLGEDAVIKFYVPFWPPIVDIEQEALHLLRHEVDFEIPKILGRGTVDGWEYLAFSRVVGTPLREVDLTDDEARSVARSLGEAMRTLHEIKVPKDSLLREVVPKWRPFLSDHRNRRRELELERGTTQQWTERLVRHLRGWRYRKRPTDTLLHADLTHDHVMLKQIDGRWQFSGLIDFGDTKVGDPAYEFAAPFAFFTAGRPDLRRAMLDGYAAGEELLDRIFESLLLHEFGRLAALDLDGIDTVEEIRARYVDLEP